MSVDSEKKVLTSRLSERSKAHDFQTNPNAKNLFISTIVVEILNEVNGKTQHRSIIKPSTKA